jgi:hypothetical protein
MKHRFLVALFAVVLTAALLPVLVSAQPPDYITRTADSEGGQFGNHDGTSTAQPRVRVGLEAGLNQSNVNWTSESDVWPTCETTYRPAWSAGVTLDVPLTPKLSLATGVRYVEYRSLGFFGRPGFDWHQVWRYVAIPVQVRMRPFPVRGVFLGLGPEAGYLLAAEGYWHHDIVGPLSLQQVDAAVARPMATIFPGAGTVSFNSHDAYSRWNCALAGSIGYEFPVGNHVGLVAARYTHGLVDIAKSNYVKRSTRGFELLLGGRW